MSNYNWLSPYDWLSDMSRSWSKISLYSALCLLAQKCDSDTIQDTFEQEMSKDGYFEKENSE